jgi:hypothetical protein
MRVHEIIIQQWIKHRTAAAYNVTQIWARNIASITLQSSLAHAGVWSISIMTDENNLP